MNKIEESKQALKKFIITIIFMLLIICLMTGGINAATELKNDLHWSKYNGHDVYCIQPNTQFNYKEKEGPWYKTTQTWTVNWDKGKTIVKNGTKDITSTNEGILTLQRAYILASKDTVYDKTKSTSILREWNPKVDTEGNEYVYFRSLYYGIYSTTSIQQEALWKLSSARILEKCKYVRV